MKYIKTYEYKSISYNNVYNFLKKIVKLFGKEYTVSLTKTNLIYINYKSKQFTEIISKISFQPNILIYEIFNTKYEINLLLAEYFKILMEKIYEKDYDYSFKYNKDTRLKMKDFEALLNINKYNL